jgi:hypothetical protein
MKWVTACLVILMVLMFQENARSQVLAGTGVFQVQLDKYGRVRYYVPDFATGTRHMDRMTIVVALDSLSVFDYTNDANLLILPAIVTGGRADTILTTVIDNSYSNAPPKVRVRVNIYAWKGDSSVIVRYATINDSAVTVPLYIGAVVSPKPSNTYGNETVSFDPTKQIGYFFRTGQAPHVGVKVLSGAASSFHALDYAVYSPLDPSSDAASDSMRYAMTAHNGFDGTITVGADGSILSLNAGRYTVAPGDSAVVYYALMYGTSLAGLQITADGAVARYTSLVTSVEPVSNQVPEQFALLQNYPNPFNPTTQIEFKIPNTSVTKLMVFDMLGGEVETLIDQNLAPGSYRVTFNAARLSSGVYYYTLRAGTYTDTKRLVLVK